MQTRQNTESTPVCTATSYSSLSHISTKENNPSAVFQIHDFLVIFKCISLWEKMGPSPQKGVLVMHCSLEIKATSITATSGSKTHVDSMDSMEEEGITTQTSEDTQGKGCIG